MSHGMGIAKAFGFKYMESSQGRTLGPSLQTEVGRERPRPSFHVSAKFWMVYKNYAEERLTSAESQTNSATQTLFRGLRARLCRLDAKMLKDPEGSRQ